MHSRAGQWRRAVLVMAVLLGGACGGGDDGQAQTSTGGADDAADAPATPNTAGETGRPNIDACTLLTPAQVKTLAAAVTGQGYQPVSEPVPGPAEFPLPESAECQWTYQEKSDSSSASPATILVRVLRMRTGDDAEPCVRPGDRPVAGVGDEAAVDAEEGDSGSVRVGTLCARVSHAGVTLDTGDDRGPAIAAATDVLRTIAAGLPR